MASEEAVRTGLAGRYATAVFELAQEEKGVDAVGRDFAALAAMLAESKDLDLFVRAPVFSREEHAKGMDALLRRMEAAPLTVRFVLTVARKGRLSALPDIIRAYQSMVSDQRGEVDAEVTAARPLSDQQTADLKQALKRKLGREPKLRAKIDPSLLGGLVVRIGSRMIDSSLRTKLEGLRTAMRGH